MHSLVKPLRRHLATLVVATIAGPGLAICATLPAHAAVPASPVWESSAPFGTWQNGKFDVYNNEWNTSVAGPQTIWAYSFHHWGVESTQANTTSVKTYPSVQENYKNTPLSSLHGLWSNYAESMPSTSNFDAEAAYDLWLNNYKIEVMMWVDNHGQRPAGRIIAHVKIYGVKFAVWQGSSHMFSFALSGKQHSVGHVHLLKALAWLVSSGYLSSSDILTQVNFGWEICSTDGQPMDFTLTKYSLTTRY
jgi:hypothetical protein